MWTPPGGALPIFVLTVGSGGPRRRNLSKSRASAVPGTPLLAFTGPKKPFGVRVLVPPRSADTPFASLRSLRECREETSSRNRTPAVGHPDDPRNGRNGPLLFGGEHPVPFERRGGLPRSSDASRGPSGRPFSPSRTGDRTARCSPVPSSQVTAKNGGVSLEAEGSPFQRPGRPGRRLPPGALFIPPPTSGRARFDNRRPRSLPRPPSSPFPGAALPFAVAVGPRPRLPRGTFSAGRARNLSKSPRDQTRIWSGGLPPSEDFDDSFRTSANKLRFDGFDGNRLEKRCEDTRN